jgi:hypothetical protein
LNGHCVRNLRGARRFATNDFVEAPAFGYDERELYFHHVYAERFGILRRDPMSGVANMRHH